MSILTLFLHRNNNGSYSRKPSIAPIAGLVLCAYAQQQKEERNLEIQDDFTDVEQRELFIVHSAESHYLSCN